MQCPRVYWGKPPEATLGVTAACFSAAPFYKCYGCSRTGVEPKSRITPLAGVTIFLVPLYCEEPPAPSYARWIECGWSLQSPSPVTAHRVPPDGCVDIIYDRRQGLRAIGAMTVEQRFAYPYSVCVTGIRFRPGMARAFLGVSPAEFTDGSVPLADLWPRLVRELRRRLDDAKSIQDAMRILFGSLPVPPEPSPVQEAITAIARAGGNADLDSVAWQANLSPRQFRRRCLEESGLRPKTPVPRVAFSARLPPRPHFRPARLVRHRSRGRLFRPGAPDSRFSHFHRSCAHVRFFQYPRSPPG